MQYGDWEMVIVVSHRRRYCTQTPTLDKKSSDVWSLETALDVKVSTEFLLFHFAPFLDILPTAAT